MDVGATINRLFNLTVAVLILAMVGLLGYQAGDKSLPIDLRERRVETPEVRAGEELRIYIRFVVNRQCSTHIDRWIFDGHDTRIPLEPVDDEAGSSQTGVEEEFRTTVLIPPEAKPGQAKYRTISVYKCNFVQRFWPLVGPIRDIDFIILPSKVAGAIIAPIQGTFTYDGDGLKLQSDPKLEDGN